MSLSASRANAEPRGAIAVERLALALLAALLLAASLAIHVGFGTVGDVSWLITVDEKWLSGATPYRDVLEINPPASLLLYLPPVALARMTGLTPELCIAAFGYSAAALCLALAAKIAWPKGEAVSAPFLGIVLAAALLLPGRAFDERDTLAAFFALPFVALVAARAERRAPSLGVAAISGLLIGAAIAIKPPYALIPVLLAPWLAWRLRRGVWAAAPEAVAMALIVVAYAGVVAWVFPAYVADVLPIGVAIYAPIRDPLLKLASNVEVLPAALMALSLFVRPRRADAAAVGLALAALGAFLAFVAQGKGWSYQAFPLVFFTALLGGRAFQAGAPPARSALALGALALAFAAVAVLTRQAPTPLALLAALAWPWLGARMGSREEPAALFGVKLPISANALFAAAFGAACGIYAVDGVRNSGLEEALKQVGPHPRVLAITESLGLGHPLVRDVGGVWVQRVPSNWIVAGALRLIGESHGDPAAIARLQPFIDADRDRLVEDIEREKPDAILVGRLGTPFHDWAWGDPKIAAARADYVLFARNEDADWPAEIYVRRDLQKAP